MSRIGLCLSPWAPLDTLRAALQTAEEAGYELCWVPEASFSRETPIVLAHLAGCTSTIRLGTGILTVYTRTAGLMAQTALSMAELAEGRFILGLGAGHARYLWENHGVRLERPLQRLRDYVHIVREAMARGRLSFHGRDIAVPHLSFPPDYPMPREAVPIYLAVLGPQMAGLAGEIADGAIFNMAPTDYLAEAIRGLRDSARRAGRDPSQVDVTLLRNAAIGPSGEKLCREAIATYLSGEMPFYQNLLRYSGYGADVDRVEAAFKEGGPEKGGRVVSDELLEDLALLGNPATWWDKVAKLEKAGVDLVCPYPGGGLEGLDAKESILGAIRGFAEARR